MAAELEMSSFYSSACIIIPAFPRLVVLNLPSLDLTAFNEQKINTEWSSFGRVIVQPAQSRGFGPQGHIIGCTGTSL